VLLGHEDAVGAERRRPTSQAHAGEDDERGDASMIEAGGLEDAVGERARQHDDDVGVRGQRIGDHQEATRTAHDEDAEPDENDDGGEQEPRATHGAARLRMGPRKGKRSAARAS
jgi:hypothetical protein